MNHKNFNVNEKKKATDSNTKITQVSELSAKDFKTAIIQMLQGRTCWKQMKKKKVSTKKESQQRNKRHKGELKWNFRTMKNRITKIENSKSGLHRRMKRTD